MPNLLAVLLLILSVTCQALEIGDKAPSLAMVTWVKQGPVEVGRSLTVVEFWATWCGPCRVSIPKLTALAAAHHDRLVVVGLSDEEAATVKPFVTAQGAKMDYNVGIVDEATHEQYMAGRDGIPYSYLIGADGTVMWHGHPSGLEKIVARVLGGSWDAKAETKRMQHSQELQSLLQTDPGADEAGLLKQVLAKTAEILAEDPLDGEALHLQVGVAKRQGDRALVRRTLAAVPADKLDAETAIDLTQQLLADDEPADRHLDLAYAFATRAVAVEPHNAAALATLAMVEHHLGLVDRAVVTQEKALAAEPDSEAHRATLGFYREIQRLAALIVAGKPLTAPTTILAPATGKKPTPKTPSAPAGPIELVP